MTNKAIQLILGDAGQEASCLQAIVTQAVETGIPLFLGRFLTDFSASEVQWFSQYHPDVVLRQYGHSRYVNADPIVADVRRIEIGLEESEAALRSGKYNVVLLSQVLNAIEDEILSTDNIIDFMNARPKNVVLMLTGRVAPTRLVERCKQALLESRTSDVVYYKDKT